ncbi:MAG: hypothetical protein ACLRL0_07990 [Christensenellaceae bacterium]
MKLKRFFKRLLIRWRKKKYDLRVPVCCKAHGVSFADRQGALAQSRSGDELQLVQVPVENYPHNVYIYSIELNRILGYLEKNLSDRLTSVFGKGFCLDGQISEITGGPPYPYFGCNIRIFETMEMMLPYLLE